MSGNTVRTRVMALRAAALFSLLGFCVVANAADTYDPATGLLTIPEIQVGQTLYTNVVVHVSLSQVISVGGGAPAAGDTYLNGVLTTAQVTVNGRLYTNVTVRVSLADIVSIGGHTLVNLSSAPGESALVRYLQTAHQYLLSATDAGGNSYQVQLGSAPVSGTTTFNGHAPAYSKVDTVNFYKNGVLLANSVSTSYFLLNPYMPLGKIASTGIPYEAVTSSTPFPATLNVGGSGSLDAITVYHSASRSVVDAEEADSYVVAANNSTSLSLCQITVISGTTAQGTNDGLANSTERDCYTVDAAGTIALISTSISVAGGTLTFR